MKPKKNKLLFIASSAKLARRPALIRSLTAIPFATLILAASGLQAQTTYSFTDATGGTQLWTDGTNWNGGVAPTPVAGDTIQTNLTQAAATFLDLEADRIFANWSANFQGFGSRTFTISSGHTITLAGTAPTITVSSGTLIFDNVLAGTDGLTKAGNSSLSLTNAGNTFSGGIQLSAGTLQASSNGAFGDAGNDITVTGNSTLTLSAGTYARDISINNAATLSFTDQNTVDISGAVTGAGGFAIGSSGFGSKSLTLSSTSNTFTGNLRIGGGDSGTTVTVNSLADSTTGTLEIVSGQKGPGQIFVWGSGATSALVLNDRQVVLSGTRSQAASIINSNTNAANTISINKDLSVTRTVAGTFELGGVNTGANTVAGVISDGGGATSLLKSGDGTWIVSGDNTYTGTTTVNAGTLLVNGSTTASSAVTVSGGTLGGTGTVGGSVTVNSGGLAPGASAGVLSIGGNLDISALAGDETGTLVFELGAVGSSDRINVTGSLGIGTELLRFSDFTFSPLAGLQDGTYTLISSSSLTTSLDPTPANLTGTVGTGTGTLAISGNNLVLQISGIGGGPTDPYGIWATGGELFGDDANGDGVSNGLAFLLGAPAPNVSALGLLPTFTETAGGLVMTFSMLDSASRGTATLSIEHSSDLGISDAWTTVAVPDSSGGPTSGVTFSVSGSGTLDVQATIGFGEAAAGKLFGRLKATE